MINPEDIYCDSSLHDSCGVVFQHQGRVYRALHKRGAEIFDLLSKDNWIDSLVQIGLVRMKWTELEIPGYHGVIECERVRPVLPSTMWTNSMLREAGVTVCKLSKELLKRNLILWDLKGMANMTFSAAQGPVFLDLGAIHTVTEVEQEILSTSFNSLFEQVASSFYFPLWLSHGALGHGRLVRQLLEYYRRGPMSSELSKAMLRRLTIGWRVLPGALKARALLRSQQYSKFYELIMHQIRNWSCQEISKPWADASDSSELESTGILKGEIIRIIGERIGDLRGKDIFDLNPQGKVGIGIADRYGANVYLLTKDRAIAEQYLGLIKEKNKLILPIVCDIWERSFHNCYDLKESCDVVCLLPNIMEASMNNKVPIDFVGRVLSLLTKRIAVVGIGKNWKKIRFPFFIAPVHSSEDPTTFCGRILGKYFQKKEVVRLSESLEVSLLILYK